MRERPKGVANIHEVEGNKDIIVIIPTADYNGKYAKECSDNVFKGLHIVFVESGVNDFYFNYAHNCNVVIKRAMDYNPKWVIVSNDDMYKIDDISVLQKQLESINNKKIDTVFTKPSNYHSHPVRFAKPNKLYYLYFYFFSIISRKLNKVIKQNGLTFSYHQVPYDSKISYLFKRGYPFVNHESFGIFSSEYLRSLNFNLFDETFINAGEDVDVSLKLSFAKERSVIVDYNIGNYIGMSLGNGIDRGLRTHAGRIYLNYKWGEIIDNLLDHRS